MTAKEKLHEIMHKLLTTHFLAFYDEPGVQELRNLIFEVRNIIDNCVVIPIEKIDKMAMTTSEEKTEYETQITEFKKTLRIQTFLKIDNQALKYIADINDELLKNLCFYLEKEEELK